MAQGIFDIRITGGPQLMALLRDLPKKVQNRALRKGTRAGAKLMLQAAKQLAPVGETGKLRRHLTVRAMKRSRVRVGARVVTGTREKMGIEPKDKWFYPSIVEFGRKDGKLDGRHYLRQAASQAGQAAVNVTVAEVRKEVNAARAAKPT